MHSRVHRYTLLLPEEIPRYLACTVIDCRPVFYVLVLGAKPLPRPLSELATREEILIWLTRVLFNTFLSGHTQPPPRNFRLPHNLVGFFRLLLNLHRVGYPAHWLGEFLGRVLSGRMHSNIVPYTSEYPIPVSHRSERVAPRSVRTDPWLVEFETILATSYYAIPFPLPLSFPIASESALPADFSRDADDIALWQAPVRPATGTRFPQGPKRIHILLAIRTRHRAPLLPR